MKNIFKLKNKKLNNNGFHGDKLFLNDGTEKGRSMIEILGVLAIVGVLSIGGIYAYNIIWNQMMANKLGNVMQMFSLSWEERPSIYDKIRRSDGSFIANDPRITRSFADTYGFKMENGRIPLGNDITFRISLETITSKISVAVLFINWPSDKPKKMRAFLNRMHEFIKSNPSMGQRFYRLLSSNCSYYLTSRTDADIDAAFEKFTSTECILNSNGVNVYFTY